MLFINLYLIYQILLQISYIYDILYIDIEERIWI